MEIQKTKPVQLEFSDKYDLAHSLRYRDKHQSSISKRLTDWREQVIARKALELAGRPQSVLDLPCGTGRFWELLAEQPGRKIMAADNSTAMLQVARDTCPPELFATMHTFPTSAFDIELDDSAVECIFSMRLIHHIGKQEDRARLLKEYFRVSRRTVCLSLWIDGNYKAWRRRRLDAKRRYEGRTGYQNRFVLARHDIETEFKQAGFTIRGHFDLLRFFSMWRIYVLEKTDVRA